MVRGTIWLILAIILVSWRAGAQDAAAPSVPSIAAVSTATRITINGRLDEEGWSQAEPFSQFVQRDPSEGEPSTEKTQVRFLYDTRALYIGIELLDSEAAKIVARISRRDSPSDSDSVTIYLDPYHDHLTGAMFQVSAAGVQQDWTISNDTNTDISWDSVWNAAVSQNDTGWFAEIEIPLSQLRFSRADQHTWGINAARYIHRKNETSWLVMVPSRENGLASRMAHLTGIQGIEPGNNLEILPYVRASTEFAPAVTGDPFHDGFRPFGGGGVDIKYGLTSSLTLDATVNPDFGQVEVDPAVVNLSAFETFFQERRPFFVEGAQIFTNFGRGGLGGGGGAVFPNYFYSRRIGRTPQGSTSGDYVDRPGSTTILGAAKLTGKVGSRWSLGLLDAVTGSEHATEIEGTRRERIAVEPRTNYFVARALRETPGRSGFGMLVTGVERSTKDQDLRDLLPRLSHIVGADAYSALGQRRMWWISGRISSSWNSGSAAAIETLQKGSQRYLQRPDATHLRFDSTATTMKGWAGGVFLSKNTGGWLANTSLAANSPGFDSNASGFQQNSDLWGMTAQLTWRQLRPDRVSRNRSISFNRYATWNFAGERKVATLAAFGNITFLNYWNIFGNMNFGRPGMDDRLTRGGPATANEADRNFNISISSDNRKRVTLGMGTFYGFDDSGGWSSGVNLNVGFKPASSLTVSVAPDLKRSHGPFQYVKTIDDPGAERTFGKRYVFANIDESSVGMVNRVNWSLSPRASIEVYSQLLFSAGDYWSFKELDRPRTLSFLQYGRDIGTIRLNGDKYEVDPDGAGPGAVFDFDEPDFNLKSLRVNAVFRWEWKPGSTLFLVWTQTRNDESYPGAISPRRDFGALFSSPATNILLVKMTYWFNR